MDPIGIDADAIKGARDRLDASDPIFEARGGTTLLDVTQDGDTYRATFSIAVRIA